MKELLQKKGINVTVFEKEDYIGGRMSTRLKERFPFDLGANFLVEHYYNTFQYLKELGLETNLKQIYGKNYSFKNGKLHLLSFRNIWSIFKFSSVSCLD